MKRIELTDLLFIFGTLLILLIIVIKNMYIGICLAVIGFILITLSWLLPIIYHKKEKSDQLLEDFIIEIEKLLNLNKNDMNVLKSPIFKSCSFKHIIDLSNKTGIDEKLLREFFKEIEQDNNFKKRFDEKKYETILGRKYDVGLVGSIYNDLKDFIKDSDEETLIKKISELIEFYSERYSLSNSIECKDDKETLKDISVVDVKNPFEFIEAIIRKRFAVPHYESNIYAFYMFLYIIDKIKMDSKIEKNKIKNIISEYLNLLIIESKLRDIFLKNLEKIIDLYMENKIKKEDIYILIVKQLEIYMKALNITRKHSILSEY